MSKEPDATGGVKAQIIAVIRSLREGEVVTYGDIAHDAGFLKMSRLVGHVLGPTVDDDLPWWRVVNSVGRLVPGHERGTALLAQGRRAVCEWSGPRGQVRPVQPIG